MTVFKTFRTGLLAASLVALAACGSETSEAAGIIKSIPAQIKARRAGPQKVSPQQLAQAFAATDKPLALFELNQTGAQFLMLEIERNGPHQTFGSSNRQAVTFRGGMITGTRGLGGDLMSVEEDSLLSVVRSRTNGVATYVQRFQTQEYVTDTQTFNCAVVRTGDAVVSIGEVSTPGALMTANCEGSDVKFSNTYIVDHSGYIISSKQWISSTLQYLTVQSLRR